MTSRGNSSISPPVQIPLQSQPRQVNISGLPSGTPPPQQPFYPGQQQVYDIHATSAPQQAHLLSYQAYGSAPNDLRGGAAGSGRGGGPQQPLAQGGTIFQQPGQTMRPQPPQQPGQPTYFISQGGGIRQPRPPQQQHMVFVPQPTNFQPANNVVIQQVGQYPPRFYTTNQPFQPPFGNYPQVFYSPANQMGGRGGMINPQNPSAPGHQRREKKMIEIKDPNSGRNVLDDILQSQRPQSTESEQTGEDASASQPASDIPNLFARKVAERLKTPETPEVPVEPASTNGEMSGTVPVSGGQYQQPPPPGPQQQPGQHPPPMGHAPMMRPPMIPGQAPMHPGHMMPPHGMMHPAASSTPPEMHQRPPVDLSLPPPQLLSQVRQPGPAQMYNVGPQQGQHGQGPHHGPRHQQPQQVVRSAPMPPAMMGGPAMPQQPQPVVPQQQQQQVMPQQPQQPVVVPAPSQPVVEPAPVAPVEEKRPAVVPPAQPAPENIPSPAAAAAAPPAEPEPVKEDSPAPVVEDSGPSTPKEPTPAREVTPPKTEEPAGANIQVSKDGRKGGKKGKKDFSRKDMGGSDMDAFIDEKPTDNVESVESKPPLPPAATDRQNSVEKTAPVEKPTFSYAAAATSAVDSSKAKEPSPPPAPTPTPEVSQVEPAKEEKPSLPETPPTEPSPPSEVAEVKEEVPAPQPSVKKPSPEPEAPATPPSEQTSAEAPSEEPPVDNVVPPESKVDSTPAEPVPQIKVNDENTPPKEAKVDSVKDESPSAEEDGFKKSAERAKPKVEESKEKLQYDRKYLMELRECPSSQTKPEGLPNLDIILDKPNISPSRSSMNAPLDFTPSFFQPSGNQRFPQQPQIGNKSGSRSRQRPDMPQQRIIKSVSIQSDAKLLHQSEKPWKPKTQGNPAEEKTQNKSLEQDVLFIMNRLTPTNFEKLAAEMRQLSIKTYDDLEQLVKIFFDKVTIETKFVQAYALLCRVMSQLKVPPPPDRGIKENQATFRVVMLTKCQQEFEADKSIIFEDPEEKKKKLEAEMEDTPDKADKIDNILYKMKLRRLKFYGNIRFIGELFKLNMLTENIMHDCIFRLLKARDDDSLLSLCQLITTVGQILDTEKAKTRMDQYFTQMEKIAEERKSRIKFTLKDAIDLRSNNWVPRKETTGPKKIDEIHKDYAQEQARNQFLQSQPPPPRNDTPQPGSRRGSRQREEQKPNDDGWNTVGSRSLKIDASKMKLSKNVVDEDNIQLGPGGGMNKFSMWGRGSFGSSQPPQESERPAPAGNRFSALRNDEDRRNFQRSPSRGDGGPASRGIRQGATAGHGRGKILARSSQEGERRDLLNSARSIVGGGRSQNSSRDNSWNREDRRPAMGPRGSREGENQMTRSDIVRPSDDFRSPNVPAAPAKKIKEMSEEEMEAKAKTILEEYLNIKDLAEAKLCVSELAGQPRLHLVVTASINDVLERNNQARELTGQYLHELVKNNILSLDVYSKGVSEVLQFAEDMVIDIPMMWTYLAQVTAPLLVGGSIPWQRLSTLLKPDLSDHCAVLLLVQLVKVATALTSEAEVAQMWQSSGLTWADFVNPSDVESFLKEKNLEFTIQPVSAASLPSRTSSSSEADFQNVCQEVERMSVQGRPNQDLVTYIEKSVPADKRSKPFVRALTTAIIKSSIARPDPKVNEEVIKHRRELLQKYINKPEFELEALFAIQAVMVELEHPKAVINTLFDSFYNEEIVSEEAFKLWETSSAEQMGKGACLMQLKQFFTWLRENEEVEASS